MATSTDNASSDNRLGNGRTDGTGNVPDELQRPSNNEPGPDLESVAVPATSDDSRVAVAGSKGSAPTWNIEHSIGMRLLLAQREVKTLEKDVDVKKSQGKDGKSFGGYKGISADQVVAYGKDILTKNGILYTSDLADDPPRKNGNKTEVKIIGRFENVDNPDEYRVRSSWGEGNDNSAHGYQKATTNAEKIIIGRMLLMTTVEDEQAPVETQTETSIQQARDAEANSKVTVAAWADAYKAALLGCRTLADLKRVRAENADMMKSDRLPEPTREYFINMIGDLEGALE